MRRTERIYHFRSTDGETWGPVGSPYQSIMDLTGWHDPVYNLATGVGFTFDLQHIMDLTPDSPLVVSTTPSERFATWRYSHWMWVDGELWVYAEVARPNESNEIRLFRLPKQPR